MNVDPQTVERGLARMPVQLGDYATVNGIRIYFQDDGDPSGEPLLLIMGLSSQLIAWPQDFVDELGSRGFRVIRFDNRDCGLSDKIEGRPYDLLEAGQRAKAAAYQLTDMADDSVGVLAHLGIQEAHIVGASMGGMIAQTIAIHHAEKVLSLCSIMSTTGAPFVGLPTLEAAIAVSLPTPPERDKAIPHIANVMRIIGSRTHEAAERKYRLNLATESYDRMFYPEGGKRQLAAILAAPDRTKDLRNVNVPTLVVHGGEDSLINISGGRATRDAVPDSTLLEVPTMGHDLPRAVRAEIIAEIDANARKAS
jgi:pimeloyl-ACP methyl ester carboxylesterase